MHMRGRRTDARGGRTEARGGRAHRLRTVTGAVAVAGPLAAIIAGTPASATPAPPATPVFTLHGSIAGRIRLIQPDQTLTFVFTETNTGHAAAPEDLVTARVRHATVLTDPPCVLPNGAAINSDNPSCEPGFIAPGQSASVVITTNVTGVSGQTASARVCLDNENTGAVGPCLTVSVPIA